MGIDELVHLRQVQLAVPRGTERSTARSTGSSRPTGIQKGLDRTCCHSWLDEEEVDHVGWRQLNPGPPKTVTTNRTHNQKPGWQTTGYVSPCTCALQASLDAVAKPCRRALQTEREYRCWSILNDDEQKRELKCMKQRSLFVADKLDKSETYHDNGATRSNKKRL